MGGGADLGEKLIFGKDFDLCAGAREMAFSPHAVTFDGLYLAKPYSVKIFACAETEVKTISVKTSSDAPPRFEFLPETWNRNVVDIGAGLAFFDIPEKSEEKGFVFGFCRHDDVKIMGAEFETDIFTRVIFTKNEPLEEREYVFCIGLATKEKAYEVSKHIMNESTEKLLEKSKCGLIFQKCRPK